MIVTGVELGTLNINRSYRAIRLVGILKGLWWHNCRGIKKSRAIYTKYNIIIFIEIT